MIILMPLIRSFGSSELLLNDAEDYTYNWDNCAQLAASNNVQEN